MSDEQQKQDDNKITTEVGLIVGFFLFVLFLRVKPQIDNKDLEDGGFMEALGLGLMRAAFWGIVGALLHMLITNWLTQGMR